MSQIPPYRLEESIGYLTYQVSGALRRLLEREFEQRGINLTADEFTIMLYIWDEPGCSQKRIATRSYRTMSYCSKVLKKLEKRGFVVRKVNASDGREKLCFLSSRGQAVMDYVLSVVNDVLIELEKHVSAGDMGRCKLVLQTLNTVLNASLQQSHPSNKMTG